MTIDPQYLAAFKGEVKVEEGVAMEGFNEDGVRRTWLTPLTGSSKPVTGLERYAEDLIKLIAILVRCRLEVAK